MKENVARLDNLNVVLVEPRGGLNIGSVCRVMANFGLSHLRLVNPQINHLGEEARRMAVKAAPLLESAEVFADLPSALADCSFSIGTTRRFGKYRENLLHPDQAAQHVLPLSAQGQIGLVFGREDRGLHNEELDMCQRLMTIPTREPVASMNLAQAVAVCLYEVQKVYGEMAGKQVGGKSLASGQDLERMFQHMRETLLDIEYLDSQNPAHILRGFRQIFGRAGLSTREVRVLQGLWSRIDWVEGERRKLLGED